MHLFARRTLPLAILYNPAMSRTLGMHPPSAHHTLCWAPTTMARPTEAAFHNFSFDATSRTGQALRNVSPLTLSSSSPPPVSSSDMNMLTQQFSQQTLSSDPRSLRAYNYPPYALQQQQQQQYQQESQQQFQQQFQQQLQQQQQQQDYSSSSSSSQSAQSYQQDYQSYWNAQTARYQRQVGTRLQYDPSHITEVSALAERMIASDEQCYVCAPQPQRTYTYPEPRQDYAEDEFTDEGIDMTSTNYDENHAYGLAYRRSMDFSTTDSRIQRPIRVRRNRRRGRD